MTEAVDTTQNEKILRLLVSQRGRWVPMPELASAAGAYAVHSRISDLRREGHQIETRIEGSRPKRSFYRLVGLVQAEMALEGRS